MKKVQYRKVGDGYIAIGECTYYSRRYKKSVTVHDGMYSDGVTGLPIDIDSDAWWFHDALCRYGAWDDGTPCANWEAATVLYDVLKRDGYWIRAPFWRIGSYLFGGGATRKGATYDR